MEFGNKEWKKQGAIASKQYLFVMRHGQRWDDANRAWRHEEGARTWDPPLTEEGVEQAARVGEKLRGQGVRVSRIVVSPFLRCVQTAAGFIKGMFPDGDDEEGAINVKVRFSGLNW